MPALKPVLRRLLRPLFYTSNTVRYRVELPRLREALSLVGRPESVLDVGAGGGFYSVHAYLPVAKRLHAVEYDPVLCAILAGELARFGARASWAQGSVLDLPVKTASHDLVCCTQVLEHIEEDERASDQLARAVRPGGHLLVTVPQPPAPWPEGGHVREGYTLLDLQALFVPRGLHLRHSDDFLTAPTQRVIELAHRLRDRLPALLPLTELRMDAARRRASQPYGLLALFQRP